DPVTTRPTSRPIWRDRHARRSQACRGRTNWGRSVNPTMPARRFVLRKRTASQFLVAFLLALMAVLPADAIAPSYLEPGGRRVNTNGQDSMTSAGFNVDLLHEHESFSLHEDGVATTGQPDEAGSDASRSVPS